MAKKSQTKAVAKKLASSPAKSSGKAKAAKSRAVPLSIGVAKKTMPARRPPLTKSRPVDPRTPAKAKPRSAMKRGNSQQEKVDAGKTDQSLIETMHHQNIRDILALASSASMKEPPEDRIATVSVAVGKKAENLPPKEAMAQDPKEAMAQETRKLFEHMRDTMGAVPPPVSAGLAFSPIGMMVRHSAYGFNFMLDALQMQRRFFEIWQPRPR